MGCDDACPYVPGTVEAWNIPDPAGRPLEEVRVIRDSIEAHVRELVETKLDAIRSDPTAHRVRLQRLLPQPPAQILDAACGPGLYAVPLAKVGYSVTGVDVGPAVIRHARGLAVAGGCGETCHFLRQSLLQLQVTQTFDAAILIYNVLEGFPRRQQVQVLRRLRDLLRPRGVLIVEMRTHPDHPGGRMTSWDVAEYSLLSDRPHLLLTDSSYDPRSATYILRETAIFDDGRTAIQQTTSQLTTLAHVPRLFERAQLRVQAVYDGWTAQKATKNAESLLVVARV